MIFLKKIFLKKIFLKKINTKLIIKTCETCQRQRTDTCPNSSECYSTLLKPFWKIKSGDDS